MIQFVVLHGEEQIDEQLSSFSICFPRLTERVSSISDYCKKLSENACVTVMQEQKNTIGFLAFYANDFVTKIGYITLIGILPEFRRKGYGTELLQYCFDTMKASGMRKVRLEVDADNKSAIFYYKKNGFLVIDKARSSSFFMQRAL